MCLVAAVVLWTDVRRFQDPVGEKYITYLRPGSADFVPFYLGACALVSGADPYRNDNEAWRDPRRREAMVGGAHSSVVYLPTHVLLYTPLVLAAGGDPLKGGNPRLAGRYWFNLNLCFLGLLAVVTWRILARLEGTDAGARARSLPTLVFLLFALSLNVGTELGLERGQSEILTALLCWSAVLLVLRDRPGAAMFLAVAAALLKGYGVLFAGGLALLLLNRRQAARAAGGTVGALVLLLLPVVRYVPEALVMVRMRAGGNDPSWPFVETWMNHGFRNLALQLAPAWAPVGQKVLLGVGFAATVLCWLRARRALRHDAAAPEAALWLSLYGICSLGTMIGLPPVSFSYNLVQVLPGALVVAIGQERLVRPFGPGWTAQHVVRIVLLVSIVFLFLYTFNTESLLPVDALGLALLLGMAAAAGAAAPWSPGREAPVAGSPSAG
jgi:glycosyl transferase family 87